ncbi:unnamed protein product, partial [Dibothriocephalus latus]
KLKVLGTLNEVALTLSELSRSGVGRAVRRLKGEPGELGKAARNLLLKWKSLLDEHIKREDIVIESSVHKNRTNPTVDQSGDREPQEITPKKRPKLEKSDKPASDIAGKSADRAHTHLPHNSSADSSARQKHKSKKKPNTEVPTTPPRSNALPTGGCEPLSLDSSSGISFEESLLMSSTEQAVEDRCHAKRIYKGDEDTDDDDGNLKFKSKQVMWAPRAKKPNKHLESGDESALLSPTVYEPQSLVDLCLGVIEKNISLVDHVGLVPFELFSRVLTKASPEDLARIEKHNPQFDGLTDDFWRRHVLRDFPEYKNLTPRYKETWSNMYSRLAAERSKRLDHFIHRSASKLKAERESKRQSVNALYF